MSFYKPEGLKRPSKDQNVLLRTKTSFYTPEEADVMTIGTGREDVEGHTLVQTKTSFNKPEGLKRPYKD